MKQGDYTKLAKFYHNRVGYSEDILDILIKYIMSNEKSIKVAEVGAGTGKLTQQLLGKGLDVIAVEPNDAMREQGKKYTSGYKVSWKKGSGEMTGLSSSSYDWVIMASSFHWTDKDRSLPEFSRILRSGKFLTVMWNPRDIEHSPLHKKIEERIFDIAPEIKRKSSGASKYIDNIEEIIVSTAHFKNPRFIEVCHSEVMSIERYMGIWYSVNDIPAQVGELKWSKILKIIKKTVEELDTIEVPYKTRSWTAKKK